MKYGKIRIEDGNLIFSKHMMMNYLPCKDILWAYKRKEGVEGGAQKQFSTSSLVIITRRKKRYQFDLTDREVLYSKDAFEKMYPASITKVMTSLIAIKYGNLEDQVTVTEDAVISESGATLCGIKPGDTLTLEQLLYGLMLPSGNDAGAAIAIHMAGSIDAFADMMNEEAKRLGATDTHFMNPHGLHDEDHYTTAYDLYLIFNEALKYPEFRTVTGSTAYTANYTNGAGQSVSKTWRGGNWYLTGEQETPDGLTVFSGKTGTTKAAGYCLIMAEKDDSDREFISVVLKSDSRPHLYDNMTNIISKIVD